MEHTLPNIGASKIPKRVPPMGVRALYEDMQRRKLIGGIVQGVIDAKQKAMPPPLEEADTPEIVDLGNDVRMQTMAVMSEPLPGDAEPPKEWKDIPERLLESVVEATKSRGRPLGEVADDVVRARKLKQDRRKRGLLP